MQRVSSVEKQNALPDIAMIYCYGNVQSISMIVIVIHDK